MQIRFCVNCEYQARDDDFEINRANRNNIESRYCPKCKSWLWSIILEEDGCFELLDWDENVIHGRDLKKILKRSVEILDKSFVDVKK